MNLDFKSIFGIGKRDDVRIRSKRSMSVRDASGQTVHLDPGDEILVTSQTASELDGQDCSIVSAPSTREPIADPTPARPQVSPAPEGWDKLPPCFTEHHDINEMFRVARLHKEMILQCRIDIWGGTFSPFAMADVKTLIALNFDQASPRHNVVYQKRIIDLESPEARELEGYLVSAENAADDYLTRLRETYGLKIQKLYLECGMKYLTLAEEAGEVITELEAVGFQIFSLRIASLGLSEFHNRRLFYNSADFLKYASFSPAYAGGRCSAGYDPSGTLRVYCDLPVRSSAGHYQRESARLAELKPLLAQARKELAAAQKVAKAA